MKLVLTILFYITWAIIVIVVYQEDKRHNLLLARIECEATQALNVVEYVQRKEAGTWSMADPPNTYCSYIQNEHPDLLLEAYGN